MLGKSFSNAVPGSVRPVPAGPGPSLDPLRGPAAGLAMGALNALIAKTLAKDGRLQLETLFSALGALAGFAAQHAVRQECVVDGGMAEDEAFLIVQSKSGERFYFGDRINRQLAPEHPQAMTLFSIVGGEAMRLGAKKEELPDVLGIFERVAKSLDSPDFGVPDMPAGHKPYLSPKKSVAVFWNAVVTAFTREPVKPVPGFALVEPKLWPLALATMAAGYMGQFQKHLSPALAARAFMEAAVPMSKVDPANVTPQSLRAH